jgi:uncharacterized surface protein with fasciclin (FAS1) repeats
MGGANRGCATRPAHRLMRVCRWNFRRIDRRARKRHTRSVAAVLHERWTTTDSAEPQRIHYPLQSGLIMLNRTLAAATLIVLGACSNKPKDDTAAKMDSTATAGSPAMATPSSPTAAKDIIETAAAAGTFNTLAKALTAAGLVETLKGTGPYTVLAPTDEAFAKIPAKDLDALMANKEELTKVLKYHVLTGNVPSSQVATMTEATTLEGGKIMIKAVDGKVVINGTSTVTSPDISASNGTIHVVNTVLMPPKK